MELFDFVEFGEDIAWELLFSDGGAEFGEEVELVVGNRLLGDIQMTGNLLVGPSADEEEFNTLDLDPVATFAPVLQLFLDRFSQN